MKLDLHVHSQFSEDSMLGLKDILRQAKRVGMQGLAVTDHNTVKGSLKAVKMAKDSHPDLLVIPGVEVSTSSGHLLALGVEEDVRKGMDPAETIEAVEALGGIAVASHPYRMWNGLGEAEVRKANFKALEVWNSMSPKSGNLKARELARENGMGMTGGSDAHKLDRVGMAYTDFINPVETVDAAIGEIARGNTIGDGNYRTLRDTAHYVMRAVWLWVGRGMVRI